MDEIDVDMSYETDLLADIIDNDPDWPAKRVARVTGLSVFSVYNYRQGVTRIPIKFWSDLFAVKRDLRILALVTGGVPVEFTILSDVPQLTGGADYFDEALKAIGQFHSMQKYYASVVRDGRIDGDDTLDIARFNRAYLKSRAQQSALHLAINQAFQASGAKA